VNAGVSAGAVAPAWRQERRRVVRTALAVGVATGAYGVSFGALSTAGGLSVLQTCALSVLVFTGASQFALVGVLAAGGGAVSATLTALLLGSRNALYGLRLAPLLGLSGMHRLVGAQLVIDESTAVAVAQQGRTTERSAAPQGLASPEAARRAGQLGFWSTGLAVFVLWNLATLLGALGGAAIGDPRTYGLDAAVPAAFLALLAPRLRGREPWAVAVAAVLLALLVAPFVPVGAPVLVAALVAVVVGLAGGRHADASADRRRRRRTDCAGGS
jgi:predicted branched-subunit amino acid permease